ncbi:MAG: DUF58 domain-containing protein [Candidatus Cloacimonetes bacterium]|nr:DUF58 domain-containing protein [Candidatus Cloacimonadota bacterium]
MNTDRTQSRWLTRASTHTGTRTRTRTVTGGTTALSTAAHRRVRLQRWGRRTWRAVKRRIEAVIGAVTPLGWFVSVIAVLGLIAGLSAAWVEGWFVAVCAAVMLIIAVPFLLGSRAYRTNIAIDRSQVVVGGEVHLAVEVQNTAGRPMLPAVIELPVGDALRELTVPLLGAHHETSLPVSVPAAKRGVITVGPLTIARQDPLGLLRRELTWRQRHHVHVHPRTVALPPNSAGLVRDLEGQASTRLVDSDLSFHAVREYVPGDAMRHIHWKSTAKTGTLMVRQYEESQSARMAVLCDARREAYDSDDEFELAVSVAASLSVHAVREGRERFVASGWVPPNRKPRVDGLEPLPSRTPGEMLDAWAELSHAPYALPIERLAHTLAHSVRDLSIVVIVTGSQPEMAQLRRCAVYFPPDVPVTVVRAEHLADPTAHRFDRLTVVTVGALGDLPQLMMRGVT